MIKATDLDFLLGKYEELKEALSRDHRVFYYFTYEHENNGGYGHLDNTHCKHGQDLDIGIEYVDDLYGKCDISLSIKDGLFMIIKETENFGTRFNAAIIKADRIFLTAKEAVAALVEAMENSQRSVPRFFLCTSWLPERVDILKFMQEKLKEMPDDAGPMWIEYLKREAIEMCMNFGCALSKLEMALT